MWKPGEPKPAPAATEHAAAAPPSTAAAAPPPKPAISSKLLGMKFMQRRQEADLRGRLRAEEAARADEARWSAKAVMGTAAPSGGGGGASGSHGTAVAGRNAGDGAVPGEPRVQLEAEAHAVAATARAPASVAKALLRFRPARRSFGDFNPKTASALAAVRDAQATASAALAEAAAAASAMAAMDRGGYDPGTVGDEEMAERYATLVGRGREPAGAGAAAGGTKRKAGHAAETQQPAAKAAATGLGPGPPSNGPQPSK